ncbi:MAG TPA: SMC-Scp complex subunit ScpB, partial [Microthrixaceae bacterium]|nr:SMC-Scp complex subunit ScpB [Microthrixaceae bacterium]
MPDGAGPADDPAETEAASPDGPDDLSPIGDEARRALEAVIMVADQPIEASILAQLVERSPQQVEDLLAGLVASYEEDGRGFQLVRVAGGWRYQSHEDLSPYVERFVLSGQSARLSAAALETLAIVAYKQPISRAQVSAIRGVNVDGVMRTLQQRGYIAEVGKDPTPGNPSMFATTPLFLEKLGLNDVDELPSLGDFIPGADVVELLEQGLRAEADTDPTPQGAPGDAPEGPDPAATVEVVDAADAVDAAAEVIDVTDHAPIDVDDLIA